MAAQGCACLNGRRTSLGPRDHAPLALTPPPAPLLQGLGLQVVHEQRAAVRADAAAGYRGPDPALPQDEPGHCGVPRTDPAPHPGSGRRLPRRQHHDRWGRWRGWDEHGAGARGVAPAADGLMTAGRPRPWPRASDAQQGNHPLPAIIGNLLRSSDVTPPALFESQPPIRK